MKNNQKSHAVLLLVGFLIAFGISEGICYLLLESNFRGIQNRQETQQFLVAGKEAKTVTLELLTDTHGSNILHPYWGFTVNRDKISGVNRFGLIGSEPPSKSNESRVVVAILGGSVAMELGSYKLLVLDALKKVKRWAGKEILLLPYGVAGGKQPQQLFQLTYLLSLGRHFDVIINLDGFNEIALPLVDNAPFNVALSFPRNWRLYSRLGLDANLSRMLYESHLLQSELNGLKAAFSSGVLKQLNTTLLIFDLLNQSKKHKFNLLNNKLQNYATNKEASFQTSGPFVKPDSDMQAIKNSIEIWQNSSIQLSKLCKSNGIEYFHFLQPNQYLEGSKPMGKDETKLAIRADHPYGQVAKIAYPLLVEAGKDLISKGVLFTDLTQMFANEHQAVYKDSCCHFNEQGNKEIAEKIAVTISKQNTF